MKGKGDISEKMTTSYLKVRRDTIWSKKEWVRFKEKKRTFQGRHGM